MDVAAEPGTGPTLPVEERPRPRPPKSPAHSAQIRIQNRRREYLERHPGYFQSSDHELSDLLLYDALIRRFQTPEEREQDGRAKGYSRVLEVDLLRGEAKLSQLAESSTDNTAVQTSTSGMDSRQSFPPSLLGLKDVESAPPKTREEGRERWEDFLRRKFIIGQDEDFDYRPVDENDAYDTMEKRDEEDAWFNEEEPNWAVGDEVSGDADRNQLQGETGMQDF